jgi:hypothetical protein
MTVASEKDFVSIGQLAAHAQKPVRDIEQAAEDLQLQPALRLNSVPYFSGDQVERLTKHLRDQR